MSFEASVHAKAIELTRLSLDMTDAAGSGHPTSAASLAHLVTVLMYSHMRYVPADPRRSASDQLVLSEGHACPIIYAAGADLGVAIGKDPSHMRAMTRADAMRLREIDSEIDGHPNPFEGFPFFPAATGSLGQGLSIAAGLALAARLDGLDKRIFCLIGDGESREGQIWEAVDFIADHQVIAVCPIFNCNHYGQSDAVSGQQSPEVTAAKLMAAGLDVRIIDGHNPTEIREALAEHAKRAAAGGKPFAIVARTVKGWGFLDPKAGGMHGRPVSGDAKKAAMAALDQTAAKLGARWTPGDLTIASPASAHPSAQTTHDGLFSFEDASTRFGRADALAKGKMAPRTAFGLALRALGLVRQDTVVLDGDVKNSTYTEFFEQEPQETKRFFQCRIGEQHMASCGIGLASAGKLPFVTSFAKFLTRAYDEIEMGMIGRFPVKYVGSHAGANVGPDGPSQMALSDIAFFRAYAQIERDGGPLLYILNPSDARSAYALTMAMADFQGPCYMRTLRPDVNILYGEGATFTLGGHQVLARGSDLLIAASGYMVHEARAALKLLETAGVRATVVDLYSLPFDGAAIAELAKESGSRVLTVEDNYGASFGGAVAEALAASGVGFQVRQMFARTIPKSGRSSDDVLRYLGLSSEHIAAAAKEMAAMAMAK